MSKKSKLSDADIKVLLDKVSFPCPRMTPPPHINQRCTMTPMENKMDKVKAETYKGNAYQIGKDYLFSDFNVAWVHSQLTGLASNNSSPFKAGDFSFQFIKEVPASENIGTITPAPVPLIHGKAYTFDYLDGKDVTGLYSSRDSAFLCISANKFNYRPSECKNIRPMAVAETLKGV
jgi:hypothetical protein